MIGPQTWKVETNNFQRFAAKLGNDLLLTYLQQMSIMIFTDLHTGFHRAKSVRIQSFSGMYFSAFGPEKLQIRTPFAQCL